MAREKDSHIESKIRGIEDLFFSKNKKMNTQNLFKPTCKQPEQKFNALDQEARERKRAKEALEKAWHELQRPVQELTAELITANKRLKRETEQRKKAEEALRESQEKYGTVLKACPDPIVVCDIEGRVVYLNPAFTHVFGWTPEEILGRKIDYVPKENWPETRMMIDRVLAGESFSGVGSRRFTKQRKILDVSISVATYLDRDGIPIGSVQTLRDITQRKHIEVQLQQAAKMEDIDTLAGGNAHDFNNLLMGIQGNVSLMLMNMDSTHPYYERLMSIEMQIQNGARLTSRLLGYTRKGRHEVKSPEKWGRNAVRAAEQFIEGTGTVLLVDDEEVILKVSQELLEVMGYRVLTAINGKEAVEAYRKNRDTIDIVLLDMVMPNMCGGEAYDRLKEINPDVKVLLSSGYGIDGQVTDILERGCDGFIQKPFSVMDLSHKLRKILRRG